MTGSWGLGARRNADWPVLSAHRGSLNAWLHRELWVCFFWCWHVSCGLHVFIPALCMSFLLLVLCSAGMCIVLFSTVGPPREHSCNQPS
jgi:hypothetical protein